ncbi:hypothetical protein KEJ19_03360 [Candidatus Bathyarchaeota archaeon]|nr:hypothetical protein [Candidatus Bathyarchaeota archaeon]
MKGMWHSLFRRTATLKGYSIFKKLVRVVVFVHLLIVVESAIIVKNAPIFLNTIYPLRIIAIAKSSTIPLRP